MTSWRMLKLPPAQTKCHPWFLHGAGGEGFIREGKRRGEKGEKKEGKEGERRKRRKREGGGKRDRIRERAPPEICSFQMCAWGAPVGEHGECLSSKRE